MTGRPWPEAKRDDRSRKIYFLNHPDCEYCRHVRGVVHPAATTHEIISGSSMSFDHQWNMISVCGMMNDAYNGAHGPEARKIRRQMFAVKVITDAVPDDVVDDFFRWSFYGKG